MHRLHDLTEWAWARHHDVLSRYVRPLFLLPLAWSAHRRSPAGISRRRRPATGGAMASG